MPKVKDPTIEEDSGLVSERPEFDSEIPKIPQFSRGEFEKSFQEDKLRRESEQEERDTPSDPEAPSVPQEEIRSLEEKVNLAKTGTESLTEAKTGIQELFTNKFSRKAWDVIEGKRAEELKKLDAQQAQKERKAAVVSIFKDLINATALLVAAKNNVQADIGLKGNDEELQREIARIERNISTQRNRLNQRFNRATALFKDQTQRERQLEDREVLNERRTEEESARTAERARKEGISAENRTESQQIAADNRAKSQQISAENRANSASRQLIKEVEQEYKGIIKDFDGGSTTSVTDNLVKAGVEEEEARKLSGEDQFPDGDPDKIGIQRKLMELKNDSRAQLGQSPTKQLTPEDSVIDGTRKRNQEFTQNLMEKFREGIQTEEEDRLYGDKIREQLALESR